MAYVTLGDLRVWLNVGSTADDGLLSACLDAAQTYVETQTGRAFEAAVTTHTFDARRDVSPDGLTLYLDSDLASVSTATNGDGGVVGADEFVTEPRNAAPYHALTILRSTGKAWTYTTDPEGAISVAGAWAYSTTAPDDVAHAVKVIAAQLYKQRDNAGDADRLVSADGVVIVPSSIPKVAADVIRKYKRLTFG